MTARSAMDQAGHGVPSGVRLVSPLREIDPYQGASLLRFSTAGSVDDGKSTLIGRLLYDSKAIFEDQLEAIETASKRRGEEGINLALLTDGLRAEREQNITIDVAYRYFATPKRKFIIADTPGHVQYTRNMITGASTADLSIILIDARKGVVTQSKRHGFIVSLLRVPHVVVAINKMDLVDFDEAVFTRISEEYREFAAKLDLRDLTFIPISALQGDNVVDRSTKMPWYQGASLLHHLETVNVGANRNLVDFRFPVQSILRPHQDYRGYAGTIYSGAIRAGEEVVVLPSGTRTRIRRLESAGEERAELLQGDAGTILLEDEVDATRGEMIVRPLNVPTVARRFEAMLCWLSETPMDPAVSYVLIHTTRTTRAYCASLRYRVDVNTLHREPAQTLNLNEVGRTEIETASPIFFDPYDRNRATGSFILVDPFTNVTVAAGIIRGEVRTADTMFGAEPEREAASPNVVWEGWNIPRATREERNGHKAAVVWLTGLSGSGKTTIAREVEKRLFARRVQTALLDGDQLRHGLTSDLGFAPAQRRENIRRAGEVARLFFENGTVVVCSFVSPYRADRARARALVPPERFIEVFVDAPVEVCRQRDPKGLYQLAKEGAISNMTGVASPYEPPMEPELHLATETAPAEASADAVIALLEAWGIIPTLDLARART
jgi:bifunctional enzyme CysN/CysC